MNRPFLLSILLSANTPSLHHSITPFPKAFALFAAYVLWMSPTDAGASGQIICEGEAFAVTSSAWRAIAWGENYYAAPYSNTFLSGDAALSALADCDDTEANAVIKVPAAGRYLVLARYEAAYRFETQFRILIDQNGTNIFMRHYGTRDSPKLWPFGRGLTEEARWPWGAVENIVWEGHNAFADLQAGSAILRLVAGHQPHPPARRNIDAIMLLTDTNAIDGWVRGQGSPDDILMAAGSLRTVRLSPMPGSIPVMGTATNCPATWKIPPLTVFTPLGQPATSPTGNAIFHAWLATRGVKPSAIDPVFGSSWELVFASPDDATASRNPWLYYYSRVFMLEQTLASRLTSAAISGTNGLRALYLPASAAPYCLGEVYTWITPFRAATGAIIPFGVDEFWRQPVGSPQMATIRLDMLRAALVGRSDPMIIWAPLPTTPPNTPAAWRRQLYAALAHGMRVVALERPGDPGIHGPVRAALMDGAKERAMREFASFEDVFIGSRMPSAPAVMLWSGTGDIWQDLREPFAAGKRALFTAIRHRQVPLDVITEEDVERGDLRERKLFFVTEQHIRDSVAASIAGWVASGGVAVAICGGIRNEFNQDNTATEELLGIRFKKIETPWTDMITFEKQDLPFSKPLDHVTIGTNSTAARLPIYAARARVLARDAEILGTFSDGTPAITRRRTAKGEAYWLGFLPGLSYFKPALPLRPVDQSMAVDSMAHFLPTNFDRIAIALIEEFTDPVSSPLRCDNPLVEGALLVGTNGTLIPLINWSGAAITNLQVRLAVTGEVAATTASGAGAHITTNDRGLFATLALEDADALILRPVAHPPAGVSTNVPAL